MQRRMDPEKMALAMDLGQHVDSLNARFRRWRDAALLAAPFVELLAAGLFIRAFRDQVQTATKAV